MKEVSSSKRGATPKTGATVTPTSLSQGMEDLTTSIKQSLRPFPLSSSTSNLSLVPATHGLYNLCWSQLLPLSLAVIILGNPVVAMREKRRSGVVLAGGPDVPSAGPMWRVGLSFLIGAFGSIVGVAASFRVATTCTGWFALPRGTAAQIAGAVTATYVGGSVNLLAVASAVGLVGATSAGGSSLLGALAAADIFLMSVYFSALVAAHKTLGSSTLSADLESGEGKSSENNPSGAGRRTFRGSSADTLSLLAMGSTICFFGNAVAGVSPLPGTSTMAVTLLTVGATRLLSRFAPTFLSSLSRSAPMVATVLLNSFFASVGASGRWAEVVGVAPAIFVFAALALAVHIVFMAAGAAMANRLCRAGLGVDDIIVASNANIGGPSTAATFAGLLGKNDLVVPAAVWGTVGYAIATTLGVGVWATLR